MNTWNGRKITNNYDYDSTHFSNFGPHVYNHEKLVIQKHTRTRYYNEERVELHTIKMQPMFIVLVWSTILYNTIVLLN